MNDFENESGTSRKIYDASTTKTSFPVSSPYTCRYTTTRTSCSSTLTSKHVVKSEVRPERFGFEFEQRFSLALGPIGHVPQLQRLAFVALNACMRQ